MAGSRGPGPQAQVGQGNSRRSPSRVSCTWKEHVPGPNPAGSYREEKPYGSSVRQGGLAPLAASAGRDRNATVLMGRFLLARASRPSQDPIRKRRMTMITRRKGLVALTGAMPVLVGIVLVGALAVGAQADALRSPDGKYEAVQVGS